MKEELLEIKKTIDEILNSNDLQEQTKQFVIQQLVRRSFELEKSISRVESNQEEYNKEDYSKGR